MGLDTPSSQLVPAMQSGDGYFLRSASSKLSKMSQPDGQEEELSAAGDLEACPS